MYDLSVESTTYRMLLVDNLPLITLSTYDGSEESKNTTADVEAPRGKT